MSFAGRVVLYLLGLFCAVTAFHAYGAERMSEERMKFLMQWAGQATGYSTYRVELPLIVYLTDEQLQINYHGDAYFRWKDNPTVRLMEVMGTYDTQTQIMYLSSEVDYTDPHNEVIVLHELVHHLQAINGEDPPCIASLEPPAYKAQSLWAKATGYGIVPDPFMVMMLSECRYGE